MIIDIVSWTIFALLMLLAAFLIYYVIATNIYARKGERFKPIVSLYTIISGSMLPTIQVYDVVVNQRIDDPTKLQEGDIITFISQSKINYGETITHRIIKVTYEDGKYYVFYGGTSKTLHHGVGLVYGEDIYHLKQFKKEK